MNPGALTAMLATIIWLGSAIAARGQTHIADPETPPSVIYVGAMDVDPAGRAPADLGFGIDIQERLNSDTLLTAFYLRGANPGIIRAFRYGLHRSRFHAGIEHGGWTLAAGEIRSERRLFGAPVVGDGAISMTSRVSPAICSRPTYRTCSPGAVLVRRSGRKNIRT